MVTRRVAGARRANPQIPPNRQLHRYNENAPEIALRGVPCTCASTRLALSYIPPTLRLAAAASRQIPRGPVNEEGTTAPRATGFDYWVYQRFAMGAMGAHAVRLRSEEHTSELQSHVIS